MENTIVSLTNVPTMTKSKTHQKHSSKHDQASQASVRRKKWKIKRKEETETETKWEFVVAAWNGHMWLYDHSVFSIIAE